MILSIPQHHSTQTIYYEARQGNDEGSVDGDGCRHHLSSLSSSSSSIIIIIIILHHHHHHPPSSSSSSWLSFANENLERAVYPRLLQTLQMWVYPFNLRNRFFRIVAGRLASPFCPWIHFNPSVEICLTWEMILPEAYITASTARNLIRVRKPLPHDKWRGVVKVLH
ncbi:hypothetical protein LOAG_09692 [Loa loa]|uniref:Uncharacterized protein n=1 Tax=Loa loa TaxID=7209 RepID=A0A1S0TR92_LOALO|nr:hypothetical protein LOAG_09692 [Loa loa]EFO18803.1 hypothetical protein LOAG_09692 [Loa loa]